MNVPVLTEGVSGVREILVAATTLRLGRAGWLGDQPAPGRRSVSGTGAVAPVAARRRASPGGVGLALWPRGTRVAAEDG
ncbi:MAG: hypothetical protein ACYCZN_06845 [Candidatus Dormibacteria bacterium]